MLKKLFGLLSLCAGCAFAGVDVNSADQATLESVKGIGTDLSQMILDERSKAPFVDWNDLMRRLKGVRAANAARLSAAGLTVGGAAFGGSADKSRTQLRPASAARQ